MKTDSKNQTILISGLSGSGKTESAKFLLQYLCPVSGTEEDIRQHILLSNPILGSFGNAQTENNRNSSRFCKYIEVRITLFSRVYKIASKINQ